MGLFHCVSSPPFSSHLTPGPLFPFFFSGVSCPFADAAVPCSRNPEERPTATKLLAEHPFCVFRDDYDFHHTDLYAKIKGTWKTSE